MNIVDRSIKFKRNGVTKYHYTKQSVRGFKATDLNMRCRGEKFSLGYTHFLPSPGRLSPCSWGYHFCPHLIMVFAFYSDHDTRFFKVESSGVTATNSFDTDEVAFKFASTEITFSEELSAEDVLSEIENTPSHIKQLPYIRWGVWAGWLLSNMNFSRSQQLRGLLSIPDTVYIPSHGTTSAIRDLFSDDELRPLAHFFWTYPDTIYLANRNIYTPSSIVWAWRRHQKIDEEEPECFGKDIGHFFELYNIHSGRWDRDEFKKNYDITKCAISLGYGHHVFCKNKDFTIRKLVAKFSTDMELLQSMSQTDPNKKVRVVALATLLKLVQTTIQDGKA